MILYELLKIILTSRQSSHLNLSVGTSFSKIIIDHTAIHFAKKEFISYPVKEFSFTNAFSISFSVT